MGCRSTLNKSRRMECRLLFISRNGLTEPLGYSQVRPYALLLAKEGFDVCILSCENYVHAGNAVLESLASELEVHGVDWTYITRKEFFGVPFGLIAPVYLFFYLIYFRILGYRVLHCRSYIPAFFGMIFNRLGLTEFVFDMRGFWIDELCAGKRISSGGMIYRILRFFEYRCLQYSHKIIVLTNQAKFRLLQKYVFLHEEKIAVIPTCVDQERFNTALRSAIKTDSCSGRSETLIFSVVGTISSGWFDRDLLADWIHMIFAEFENAAFVFVSGEKEEVIEQFVLNHDLSGHFSKISHKSLSPSEMAGELFTHVCSGLFYKGFGESEVGRSPTKIGELLCAQVPFVVSQGIGDIDDILATYEVGVSVCDSSELRDATMRAVKLKSQTRFRHDAERLLNDFYSLSRAAQLLPSIYSKILK